MKWVGGNLETLGINSSRLLLTGQSESGGLAAGVALLVRDKGGSKLKGQLLISPMLDYRNESTSSKQLLDEGTWTGMTNIMAWKCILGEKDEGDVSIYSAPGRATDLRDLLQSL